MNRRLISKEKKSITAKKGTSSTVLVIRALGGQHASTTADRAVHFADHLVILITVALTMVSIKANYGPSDDV